MLCCGLMTQLLKYEKSNCFCRPTGTTFEIQIHLIYCATDMHISFSVESATEVTLSYDPNTKISERILLKALLLQE